MTSYRDQLAVAGQDRAALAAADNEERKHLEASQPLGDLNDLGIPPTTHSVSEKAAELIVMFEVSSKDLYERRCRHPTWPQGRSGVTVGIGYDVGFVSRATLASDWAGHLSPAALGSLGAACGVTGPAAKALLPDVQDVEIPFDVAMTVFRNVTLAKTVAQTLRALPNAAFLPPDSFGALVSLVYNRGASFEREGDRFLEMRQIREDLATHRLALVPGRLRSMKRLWEGERNMRGLVKRRELEAVLFEEGLAGV